jgi:ATP-binding cassette subfamily B protein
MLNTVLTAAGERTVIMISHDMSFSKRADKILFFEEGNLTESGSHDMLMKNNQNYAVFFNSQAEAFGIRSQEGEDNNEE